jgi:hypothetical protein
MKLLIYMQAFMLIIHHSILCTNFIITHTYASYRIAGGSFGSGARREGESISIGDPGTGGARDRGAKRGTPGVHGPPAKFI